MLKNKLLMTIVVLLLVIVSIVGIKILTQGKLGYSAEKSRTKGNPDAPVKVVEYIDFQCPMCAMGAKKLKEYTDKYPEKIYLEMHYFPLEMHKHAMTASQYAECAAQQGKFWEFQDVMLDKQRSWSEAANATAIFDIYAKEVGLDMNRLKTCLPGKSVNQLIEKSKKEGRDLGIRSTPTYFVNGKMVVGIKLLQEEVDPLLGIPKSAATAAPQK